jgi:hypothetical protein
MAYSFGMTKPLIRLFMIASICVACICVGCNDRSASKSLLGVWELSAANYNLTMNYLDGYRWTMTMSGNSSETRTGTWNLHGDVLTCTVEMSTSNPELVGERFSSTILELDEDLLVIRMHQESGSEQVSTWRKRAPANSK